MNDDDGIPVEFLRKASVKWYIVPKNKVDEYTQKLDGYGIVKKYEDENRVVFADSNAHPMVFYPNGDKIESVDYRVTTNTIELTVNEKQAGNIIFNNIYNPFFQGYIDGGKVDLTALNDIHFSIQVPKGKHQIVIKYKNPYFVAGTCIMSTFLAVVLAYWGVCIILKRRRISIIKRGC
jgi:uncharacterized membrane protein YfhO